MLAAQGLHRARPTGPVTARHVSGVVARLGLFQIDSVNVLARAHYLPLFSRLGPYRRELLHQAAERPPRRLVEYWAHEAALLDVRLWPAMRWRMDSGHRIWGGPARIGREEPQLVEDVLEAVRQRGPVTARELDDQSDRDRDHWGWNWSQSKLALEHLFHAGRVSAAGRTPSFERRYDLPERVLPPAVLAADPLSEADAHDVLVEHAARALGVATAPCLRDYFRLPVASTRGAIARLEARGALQPVRIGGWARAAWRHVDAVTPRTVRARALLSPFDPLVFERTRTQQIFDFRYRIEIYTPRHLREYGYYVLPFLYGDQIVARVDLKADRERRRLIVLGAWAEPSAPPDTDEALSEELRDLAGWLDLVDIEVADRGDLSAGLRRQIG